jgi:hypothetical protein
VFTAPVLEEFFGVWAQTALPKIANKQIAIESLLIILGLLLIKGRAIAAGQSKTA